MKENEIRPQKLFDELLRHDREDIRSFFSDASRFRTVACPGCAKDEIGEGFEKEGFRYVTCGGCGSLYVSPRPTEEDFRAYQLNSRVNEFFSTQFYRETALARRERIYRPLASYVASIAERFAAKEHLVDVGSGFGIFLEEVRETRAFARVSGIEPSHGLAEDSRRRGFHIIEKPLADVDNGFFQPTFITAFEVVEHVLDLPGFLRSVHRLLGPQGIFLFTTLTIDGYDLQVLWDRSKTVFPPQHLNFLSRSGFRALVRRSGFEILELETPGELDVDIVRNWILNNPSSDLHRFARTLAISDDATRSDFQEFLKSHRLSSHIRMTVRKAVEPPAA